jgi:hypothetical protein
MFTYRYTSQNKTKVRGISVILNSNQQARRVLSSRVYVTPFGTLSRPCSKRVSFGVMERTPNNQRWNELLSLTDFSYYRVEKTGGSLKVRYACIAMEDLHTASQVVDHTLLWVKEVKQCHNLRDFLFPSRNSSDDLHVYASGEAQWMCVSC